MDPDCENCENFMTAKISSPTVLLQTLHSTVALAQCRLMREAIGLASIIYVHVPYMMEPS